MRKIIFILLLGSLNAGAQTITQWYGGPNTLNSFRGFVQVDSGLSIPKDTIALSPARKLFPFIAAKGDSLYRWSTAQNKYVFIGSGSAVTWGSITGTLSTQTDLQTALDAKQNEIALGTTAQYFRGNLSLSTFSSDVTAIGDLNYANITHTHSGLLPIGGTTGQIIKKNSSSDYDYSWQDEGTGYVLSTRQILTGYGLSGGGDLTTDRTLIVDSAAMAGYFLRRKDSSVNGGYYPYATNPKSYLVAADIAGKLNTSDTAAMKLQRDSDTTLWDATKTDLANAIAGIVPINLSNTALTADGNYEHDWSLKNLHIKNIGDLYLRNDETELANNHFKLGPYSLGLGSYLNAGEGDADITMGWGYDDLARRYVRTDLNAATGSNTSRIRIYGDSIQWMHHEASDPSGDFDYNRLMYSVKHKLYFNGDSLYSTNLFHAASANDSVVVWNPTTKRFGYKSITSGGSGSPNSNIGSGYRLAVPNTNNIKTLFNGYSVLIDSSSNTNGLTLKVDTANISTKAYAQSLVDALSGGYTNLTQFVSQNNWKLFYSNGSGDVQELALGASGTVLQSNGTTSAPSFGTVTTPSLQQVTDVNNIIVSGSTMATVSAEQIVVQNATDRIALLPNELGFIINDGFNNAAIKLVPGYTGVDKKFWLRNSPNTNDTLATLEDLRGVSGGGGSYADADVEDYLETYTGDVTFTGTVSSITSGSIVNTDINASAAIAYSKLNLTGAILNADLAGSIAYAKLSLTNSITGTDIALGSDAQGDIMYYNGTDWTRLSAGTDGQFLETNGTGANPQWSTVSGSSQWANETGGISYTDKVLVGSTGAASAAFHVKKTTVADVWVQGGSANGDYAQIIFSNGTPATGTYAEFVRFSNASSSNAGDFIIDNLTKRIVFSTSYSSGYREDLVVTSAGNVSIGGELGAVGLGTFNNGIAIAEIAAPSTPASGFGALYPKTDGKLYWKDDAGTEYDLTSAGGATTFASLTDVNLTSIATNDFLKWDGTDWINRTPTNVRTDLGLVIGTNVQAYDADLTTYAGITPSANVQTLLGSADFAAFKTSLSLNNVDNTSDATKNSATATLTNKRITARTGTTTSSATPTINTDNVDEYYITAQTVDITSFTTNLSGTPTDGQRLCICITGTASRAITWGASFEASSIALPTTTSGTSMISCVFKWNATTSKWRIAGFY